MYNLSHKIRDISIALGKGGGFSSPRTFKNPGTRGSAARLKFRLDQDMDELADNG
jgi:hypothetical protein